jgi:anti-sigma factor RsiW
MSEPPIGCSRAGALLSARPDGLLEPAADAALARHLEACEACAREAAAQAGMARAFRKDPLPAEALPCGAAAAIWVLEQEAARARARRLVWTRRTLVTLPLTAVLAVLLVFGPRAGAPPEQNATGAPPKTAPLPALVIVDDEDTGRSVVLASDWE